MFCRILCCFVAKSLFYAIYAVLSRNLFCRYLRALAWRKIGPKILSVEKKGQISGSLTKLREIFQCYYDFHPVQYFRTNMFWILYDQRYCVTLKEVKIETNLLRDIFQYYCASILSIMAEQTCFGY